MSKSGVGTSKVQVRTVKSTSATQSKLVSLFQVTSRPSARPAVSKRAHCSLCCLLSHYEKKDCPRSPAPPCAWLARSRPPACWSCTFLPGNRLTKAHRWGRTQCSHLRSPTGRDARQLPERAPSLSLHWLCAHPSGTRVRTTSCATTHARARDCIALPDYQIQDLCPRDTANDSSATTLACWRNMRGVTLTHGVLAPALGMDASMSRSAGSASGQHPAQRYRPSRTRIQRPLPFGEAQRWFRRRRFHHTIVCRSSIASLH